MAESRCIVCGEATINKCGRCKSAHYCSTKCQKLDRPLHRLLCNTFTPFLATRPASENIGTVYDDATPKKERIRSSCYKLAILLPENSLKPELIWLNIQTIEECVPLHRPQLPGYDTYQDMVNDLGKYMDLPQVDPQERFGRKFVICMSDSTAPAPKNVCIAKLISGYECNSVLGDLFSRNYIIAEAYLTEKQDPFNPSSEYSEAVFYHITLADLRHAFKKFSKSSNIFDSDKTNSYYVRKEAE
jgi:MYND finger